MTHYMKLHERPFEMIRSGEKTIELRLNDEKRKDIKAGDIIVFSKSANLGVQMSVIVSNIYAFANFEELYESLPLDKCGYMPHELNDASPKDMEAYYSYEKQKQYGVLGIEIKPI